MGWTWARTWFHQHYLAHKPDVDVNLNIQAVTNQDSKMSSRLSAFQYFRQTIWERGDTLVTLTLTFPLVCLWGCLSCTSLYSRSLPTLVFMDDGLTKAWTALYTVSLIDIFSVKHWHAKCVQQNCRTWTHLSLRNSFCAQLLHYCMARHGWIQSNNKHMCNSWLDYEMQNVTDFPAVMWM